MIMMNKELITSEKALLSIVFQHPHYFNQLITSGNIFQAKENRQLYDIIKHHYENGFGIDLIIISNYIMDNSNWNSTLTPHYVSEIYGCGFESNFDIHFKVVFEAYSKLKLTHISKMIHNNQHKISSVVIQDIQAEIMNLSVKKFDNWVSGDQYVERESKGLYLNDKIHCGYKYFDLTGGLAKGELMIISARTSIGKTTFAVNIASKMALKKFKVGLFSLEMTHNKLYNKILSIMSGVGNRFLESGKLSEIQAEKKRKAIEILQKLQIFIDDTSGIEIEEIRRRAINLKNRKNIDILIVDYLQLVNSLSGFRREEKVANVSRILKEIAKTLNIPVIALAQMNRKIDDREKKIPRMSDLRDSGAIEQDADIIVFLTETRYIDSLTVEVTAWNKKNRNGQTGQFQMVHHKNICRMED